MTTAWLEAQVLGFVALTPQERDAISNFTLLWTLFEGRILATKGCAAAICKAVDAWENAGTLDVNPFEVELGYFRNRYFANGDFTEHFARLNLRRNDEPKLLRAVLDGSDVNASGKLSAILIIILRFRNNLFHGVKWQYHLAGQLENFTHANAVLMRVLESHGDLQGHE